MADLVYPLIKGAIFGKATFPAQIDFDTDPLYGLLVTSTYVVSVTDAVKKTHQFRSDLTGEVAAGGGYTTGGMLITTVTITQTGDNFFFDAADLVWSTATITARGLIVFKRVGVDLTTPTDDPLILLLDFASDKSSSSGNFTVQFAASGILSLS